MYEKDLVNLTTIGIEARVETDVRFLSEDDIAEYVDQIIRERSFITKEAILRRLQDGRICLVARLSGSSSIIGYVWLGFDEIYMREIDRKMKLRPGEAYLYDGFVLRMYRGKKVLQKLLGTACQYLRDKNFRKAYTAALSTNIASRRAVDAVGFSEKGNVTMVRLLWIKRYTEQWGFYPPLLLSG